MPDIIDTVEIQTDDKDLSEFWAYVDALAQEHEEKEIDSVVVRSNN